MEQIRRALLAGAAAVAVPGSALAVPDDPIFAAIAVRKATLAALIRAPDDEFLDAACEAELVSRETAAGRRRYRSNSEFSR
jgi:hypothetical protein